MNNISNFSLSDIVNNLGITYIYKLRRGVINKNPQDYYEVMWADIGFITEDNIFISLMNNVGEMYQMGNGFDDEEFAIDFKSFKELSNEYIGYEPELF